MPLLSLLIDGWLDREAHETETLHTPEVLPSGAADLRWACWCLGRRRRWCAASLALAGKAPRPGVELAALLKQNPGEYALSFGHFLDLNRQAMGVRFGCRC